MDPGFLQQRKRRLFHDLLGQLNIIVLAKEQLVGFVDPEQTARLVEIEAAVRRAEAIIHELKQYR